MERDMQISDLLASIEGGAWPFRPAFGAGYEADIHGMSVQHYQLANSAYCGSLDAAKALHEAVLPGWFWSVDAQGEAEVALVNQSNGLWRVRHSFSDVVDDNPARSWLIAILKALIAQENDA